MVVGVEQQPKMKENVEEQNRKHKSTRRQKKSTCPTTSLDKVLCPPPCGLWQCLQASKSGHKSGDEFHFVNIIATHSVVFPLHVAPCFAQSIAFATA